MHKKRHRLHETKCLVFIKFAFGMGLDDNHTDNNISMMAKKCIDKCLARYF